MQAVILTAGLGTRLRPVTEHVPKPLIPFWGKPFVAYLLDSLEGLAEEVIIVVGTDGELPKALGDSYGNLALKYIEQPAAEGTGDAILRARDLLADEFLLLLGDTLPPPATIEEIMGVDADAAQTLIEVDDPENHPGIAVDETMVVQEMWVDDSNLVDAGMFRLPRRVCEHLDTLEPLRNELRVLQGIQAIIAEGGRVRGVQMPQPWLQFGDHEGVAGICRVLDQIRPYTNGADEGRNSSVEVACTDCNITNSLVFGPGELVGCTITNSLVYCGSRVEGKQADGEMVAWA